MKRGGYTTGAIVTHEYFNDWGIEQGVDGYDNSIGAKPDPMPHHARRTSPPRPRPSSPSRAHKKWFLWCHYIDPHGRYVAHPDDVEYGTTEEDLYDGEIAYTDKHIGRLLDDVAHSPATAKTIIVVTSDHGDGFNEHGFINHGIALYRELLHVPLIFYVPDNEPPRPSTGRSRASTSSRRSPTSPASTSPT